MTELTALDTTHAAMQAAPQDDAARLRFFERLADSELFLLLTEEAKDDNISPEVFDVADGRFVLVFDREDRLAQFAQRPVPYVALSGRILAAMLTGQGIGLGLNLETASSSMLIPSEALGWLASTLQHEPEEVQERLAEFLPPTGLPDTLLAALDAKLATAGGLAQAAFLVATKSASGAPGHLLGFVGAVEGAEAALAKAASETLVFSGIEAGAMDVSFFAPDDPAAGQLERAGLRFDLPQPKPARVMPEAPGRNPDKPPILK